MPRASSDLVLIEDEAVGDEPALRARVVITPTDLADLAPGYEALVETSSAPVSMRWPVLGAWLATHPSERPQVVVVHRGNRLVAAAPLTARRRAFVTTFSKLGVPGEPYRLLSADRAAEQVLVAAVAGLVARRRLHRLVLDDLPDPDPTTDLLAAKLARSVRRSAGRVPVLDLRVSAGRPALTRNTRQAVAKARNRACREGHALAMRWTSAPDDIEAVLPQITRLHMRRSADLGRESLLLLPAERTVFEETIRSNAREDRVRLLLTTLDDELAAFALCLLEGRQWWVWANYADPAWLRYSPGTVTNAEVVRAATADPEVDHLDWGAGVQRYKLSGPVRLLDRQRLESASTAVTLLLGVWRRLPKRVRQALAG